jgi:hypothetical protein
MGDKTKWPFCAGTLKNGERCNRVVLPDGSGYCKSHEPVTGLDPERLRRRKRVTNYAAESEPVTIGKGTEKTEIPTTVFRATAMREQVREGPPNEKLIASLVEILDNRQERSVVCPHCKQRHTVLIPDGTARTKAAQLLWETGWGKPPQERPEPAPVDRTALARKLEARHAELRAMSEEKLRKIGDPFGLYGLTEAEAIAVAYPEETEGMGLDEIKATVHVRS